VLEATFRSREKNRAGEGSSISANSYRVLARVDGLTVDNQLAVPNSQISLAHGVDVRAAAVRASLDAHSHRLETTQRLTTTNDGHIDPMPCAPARKHHYELHATLPLTIAARTFVINGCSLAHRIRLRAWRTRFIWWSDSGACRMVSEP
jgi:hypothetical protein